MTTGKGLLNILLHAHLPFIKHPEYESFLEENWLFEALTESYLPQLRMANRLESESIPINLTFSFSPTLIAMLQDDLLKERYRRYLLNHIELGEKEVDRTQGSEPQHTVATKYLDNYRLCLHEFDTLYGGNILKGYDHLQKEGLIEIVTTPGSYPFLPFYQHYPRNIAAHVEAAIDTYHLVFGKTPKGLWLPECGYYPGLEHILADYDISYFFSSAHGLLFADNPPEWGVFAPAKTPRGVAFFARDLASAGLVWSAQTGYPGDPEYRDFYRDIGHDLEFDYVKPYIHLEEIRISTGYKYYAVSGKEDNKHFYDPQKASERVKEHAGNFLYHQSKRIKKLVPIMDQQPVITCPYTAELFGHWWFEGVDWLETVIRYAHSNHGELELTTPSGYLEKNEPASITQPIFSSWGNKGYAEVWLEGSNDWIYRHIHMAIERLQELIGRFPDATGLKERALNQAAREVLMAQSIDWPVIMRSGTSEEYAAQRIREHIGNFYRIYDAMSQGTLGTEWLTKVEKRHNVFPRLNYKVFLPSEKSTPAIEHS